MSVEQVTATAVRCEHEHDGKRCPTTYLVEHVDTAIVLALAAERAWIVDDEDGPDLCPRHAALAVLESAGP